MSKEKIHLINSRSYKYLSTNRLIHLRADKNNDEFLIIDIVHKSGDISFTLNDSVILENPDSGEYTFPLVKGEINSLKIKSKSAIGSYKVRKKTIIEQ